jgi:hypothetical protein
VASGFVKNFLPLFISCATQINGGSKNRKANYPGENNFPLAWI